MDLYQDRDLSGINGEENERDLEVESTWEEMPGSRSDLVMGSEGKEGRKMSVKWKLDHRYDHHQHHYHRYQQRRPREDIMAMKPTFSGNVHGSK